MSTTSPPDSVFLDTCILLNYVNRFWEGDKVSDLLDTDDVEHVISETVAEEFEDVCERREEIYPDMVSFLLEASEDEDISSFDPSERDVRIAGNDRNHVRTIQFELASVDDQREVLRLLRRFLRNLETVIETVTEDIVDTVVEPCAPILLTFRVADVVPNDADAKVVCDAAQWTADGGPGVFATLDSTDLLDNETAINEVLEREESTEWCLTMIEPKGLDQLSAGPATKDH
jgi:hypothetical protein